MAGAVSFASPRFDPPLCAQCDRPVACVRVERRAFQHRTDKFLCTDCGLVDKIVRPSNPARVSYRLDDAR